MTTATVTADSITIELSAAERALTLRGDIHIPRSSITGVELVDDGFAAVHGVRAPGLGVPGHRLLATMRGRHGQEFADIRRGERAVRLTLTDHPLSAVVISGPTGERLAEQLRAA